MHARMVLSAARVRNGRKKILAFSRVNVPNPPPCLCQAESWQPMPSYAPFSARGSLAETEASQRLVEAIYLIRIVYRTGPPNSMSNLANCELRPMPRFKASPLAPLGTESHGHKPGCRRLPKNARCTAGD